MTQEQKAKAYDEAIKKAKDMLSYKEVRQEDIEYLFPELKESEDEKIRKSLINYFSDFHLQTFADLNPKKILAWLEKQGEHKKFRDFIQIGDKVTRNESGELVNISQLERVAKPRRAKSADKVEPKFHEGEWITNGDYTWKIVEVKPLDYILKSQDGNIVDDTISHVDEQFHSFTVQDAKDGDVLQLGKITAIFKEFISNEHCKCCCSVYNGEFEIRVDNIYGCYNATPATKEQRDLLFQKLKEAGYEWNVIKKELKKIKQKLTFEMKTPEESLDISSEEYNKIVDKCIYGDDKSTWSKEDDYNLQCMIAKVTSDIQKGNIGRNNELIDWLKSLKDRVQPQQRQDWKQENIEELSDFENAMMHIGGSFFGENAGLDPNNTVCIKEQANLLLELIPKQEWSEADEQYLLVCKNALVKYQTTDKWDANIISHWLEDKLKSLKDRYTWKPSDGQMNSITCAVRKMKESACYDSELVSLYQDLKKLTE